MRSGLALSLSVLAVLAAPACSNSSSGVAPDLDVGADVADGVAPADQVSDLVDKDTVHPSPFEVTVFDYAPEAATGVATGDYFKPALSYPAIPVDSKYKHILSFQLTPWAFPLRKPDTTNGPVVLFSDDLETLVFSPLDHPFISLVGFQDGALQHGVQGDLQEIPQGFRHRFVLVKGQGINATLEKWGEVLRTDRGITKRDRYADSGLSYLGYWTDNGAEYFYKTLPEMNYHQTLMAVKQEADELGIPYGYFQIDSWWYFRGPEIGIRKGGLMKWEPDPLVFPDGLEAFQQELGLPLVAHNKWFVLDNAYVAEHEFVAGESWSIPLEGDVYKEFMTNAAKWGIETYEPDWLMSHIWEIPWLRQGAYNAETWMDQQNDAAAEKGITMQLCMAGAAHLQYTIDVPAVTTFRTSIDYKRDVSKESFWPMFHTVNMLASAVGVWPFKDNFWSSEKFGEAEALISVLSGGMVGVGDPFGAAKPDILLRTCRKDGLLLKPDRPATPLDAMFLPHQRPYTTATWSDVSGAGRWVYLSAYLLERNHPDWGPLDNAFAVFTYDGRDLGEMFVWPDKVTNWSVDLAKDLGIAGKAVLFDWRSRKAWMAEGSFEIPQMNGLYDYAHLVLAPVFENGLALIGEADKYVTLADKRFASVQPDATGITVQLTGAPGETVHIWAYDTQSAALLPAKEVVLDDAGKGSVRIER